MFLFSKLTGVPAGLLSGGTVSSAALPTASAGAAAPGTLGDAAATTLSNVATKSFGSVVSQNWGNTLAGPDAARAFSTASGRDLSMGRAVSGGGRAVSAARALQQASASGTHAGGEAAANANAATLPPHPKQKNLLPPQVPQAAEAPQPYPHGASDASSTIRSSLMLRNAWEDNFFNNLMMGDGAMAASRAASLAGLANAGALGMGTPGGLTALAAAQAQQQMGFAGPFFQNRMQSIHNLGLGGLRMPSMGMNPTTAGESGGAGNNTANV